MNQRAFSFFELLIVISLIGILYALFLSKISINTKPKNQDILKLLKSDLLKKFAYEKQLKLVCLLENLECYVVIDSKLNKQNPYEKLFSVVPEIYSYEKEPKLKSYSNIEIENMNSEEVIFEFIINSDRKINEQVIKVDEMIYLYDNMHVEPRLFKTLDEITLLFEDKISEVKDAF